MVGVVVLVRVFVVVGVGVVVGVVVLVGVVVVVVVVVVVGVIAVVEVVGVVVTIVVRRASRRRAAHRRCLQPVGLGGSEATEKRANPRFKVRYSFLIIALCNTLSLTHTQSHNQEVG